MTIQTQVPLGEVALPIPPKSPAESSSWIAGSLLPALKREFGFLRNLLGRLTIANMSAYSIVETTSPGVADTQFTVNHNLGRVPKIYAWNVDKNNAIVYDDLRSTWTTTQMFLKCSQASVKVSLLVL